MAAATLSSSLNSITNGLRRDTNPPGNRRRKLPPPE
jgi:hypothetical protein